jgi:hypothetical protein
VALRNATGSSGVDVPECEGNTDDEESGIKSREEMGTGSGKARFDLKADVIRTRKRMKLSKGSGGVLCSSVVSC